MEILLHGNILPHNVKVFKGRQKNICKKKKKSDVSKFDLVYSHSHTHDFMSYEYLTLYLKILLNKGFYQKLKKNTLLKTIRVAHAFNKIAQIFIPISNVKENI